jgi:uncharacterized membrane protein (DUF373 family)
LVIQDAVVGHDLAMTASRSAREQPDRDDDVPARTRVGNTVLEIAETVVYVGIAVLLWIAAMAVLVYAGRNIVDLFGSEADSVALEMLDTLLLAFIVVELLFAVRSTLAKRELIAEPFLLVGIIASIKEIVVLAVKAAETAGDDDDAFKNQLLEIGVLGVLVLLLGITALLLRRKEREPGEGDESDDPFTPDRAGGEPAVEAA